jgi:aspartyl-tRNA(Asn)/glutamyl-tRNA(Gln) amidotransferase subunit A
VRKYNFGFLGMKKKIDPFNSLTFLNGGCTADLLRVAVKDNIAVKGWPLTGASKFLADYSPDYDATCISHLKRVPHRYRLLGKCNLDEFAMGSNNLHSHWGGVEHPRFPGYSPGGSSGGSAVAVAAGIADLALGSDTGGSVRLPASYCGVIGFKSSYGAVSRHGLIPYAPSLDSIGILGRDISEVRDLFSVISQECPHDPKYRPLSGQKTEINVSSLKFGTLRDFGQFPTLVKKILDFTQTFEIPFRESLLSIYYIIALSEAASSLARYKTDTPMYSLPERVNSRSELLGEEARKRIILGTALKSQFINSYFHAHRLCLILKEAISWIFQKIHVLVVPTTNSPPPKISECTGKSERSEFNQDDFLVLANLTGIPALSLPLHPADRVEEYRGIFDLICRNNADGRLG